MLVNGIHISGEEVEYAVGHRRYTILILLNGHRLISSRNLEKICDLFGLLRTHKSSAVNPTYISGYTEDGIQMQSGFTAQMSRRRKITEKKSVPKDFSFADLTLLLLLNFKKIPNFVDAGHFKHHNPLN